MITFVYQENNTGKIHVIRMEEVNSIEIDDKNNCLHVTTTRGTISIERIDACRDFKAAFNEYLYSIQAIQNFIQQD